MKDFDQKERSYEEVGELNRNLISFCGHILVNYQDVLNDRELFVCQLLIKGQSLLSVSKTLGLSKELVRLIFLKAIRKIKAAYHETIKEMAMLKEQNEALKIRNQILENELLSEQSLKEAETVQSQQQALCRNARRLLNTPIDSLPLPPRVKNVLSSANITHFSDIPQFSIDNFYKMRNCGRKTIEELQAYLSKFSLEMGMTYDEIVARLATLSDEDIQIENVNSRTRLTFEKDFAAFIATAARPTNKENVQVIPPPPQIEKAEEITLNDICARIGLSKKGKRKWSRKVKQILLNNNIDTLDKLLSIKPDDFLNLEGVGKTTLYHTRKAIESFGIVWSDATT